jgi:putative endonuclease
MYFVYIIYSSTKNKFYIGFCQDIDERVRRHNTNHDGFTGKAGDWIVKWTEEYQDKSAALKREKQIKA